ncbi:hypothetical protein VD0002_g7859 [Verticillium dahliae]|uniref:Uncharacterized protein n=2 Tax=Verticillium dahliae TaxID=27337 RepID=G2XA98_VERDV|nr:uncharacterized protein VDAG_07001 [Verticillium dahliae VdLs.17]KAF3343555.1 Guanine nucleotide-binding protein subunit beta-like protein [Verticillium dahliae VDG2]PNH36680.1 hypothetical protein BJF96_g394 [Verticillium dahliae]EGY15837.1 hypothetical protein VDAG_07001 [Verticillium dahliae VdLs.17]PNH53009.1 hypothetical protein VD0003_g4352 [Verticillium dahliae]PNH59702.1 hypothetical protein VD0002_g7859 [Verticillium dahliae]
MSSSDTLIFSLATIPSETLDLICSHFCLHCNRAHAVDAPLAVVDNAFGDQKTLSALSRTCRRLRAHAQPVLFHLYHAALPHTITGDRRTFRAQLYNARCHFREKRLLALFLRTLLDRQDLAASVRALALYQAPWTGLVQMTPTGNAGVTDMRQLQVELIADVTARSRQKLRHDDSGGGGGGYLAAGDAAAADPGDSSLELLQDLTVALCAPSLDQLLIERMMRLDELADAHSDWRAWSYDLPRLTYLAFPGLRAGGEETYYYKEARNLVARAPNLRVLVAPDCEAESDHWMEQQYSGVPWDLSLAHLRRLSISGIERGHLRAVLAGCPVLEDLEYFCEDTGFEDDVLCPGQDLALVVKTLRRLCYSVIGRENSSSINAELRVFDEEHYPSWAGFPALQTLEIDRMLIYGPTEEADSDDDDSDGGDSDSDDDEEASNSDQEQHHHTAEESTWPSAAHEPQDSQSPGSRQTKKELRKMRKTTPEDFLSRLPPSLEMLRIGHITSWPAMHRDAVALADQAARRFPCLRTLRLEVVEMLPPQDEVTNLVSLFEVGGISCSVRAVERQGRDSRGLLPVRLAQSGPQVVIDEVEARENVNKNAT